MRTRWLPAAALSAAVLLATGCSSGDDTASDDPATSTDGEAQARVPAVPAAELDGPITTGILSPPNDFRAFDVSTIGYAESEWFAFGTATAYQAVGDPGGDGHWEVETASTAQYRTRFIVRRPVDPARWNGTVVIEWLNVSGGFETPAEWSYTSPAIADAGAVYVALSAQALGINGGTSLLGENDGGDTVQGIRATNPQRYFALGHPGDRYSFDIASQVGAALRSPAAAEVLGGEPAEHIILSGESQSAGFLVTYIDAVQPVANVYDGFFVHSRGGGAASLDASARTGQMTEAVRIRDDLDAPVLILETETDIGAPLFYAPARQRDTEMIRTWEIAGTAHADAYYVGGSFSACPTPINDGPHHYVAKAGMAALLRWVEDGEAPPAGEAIATTGRGTETVITRDEHGIAEGGIRTPSVDVPVSTLTGEAAPGGPFFCEIFGGATPYDNATLDSLYGTSEDYLEAFDASLEDTIEAGYVRPEDADEYRAEAAEVVIP